MNFLLYCIRKIRKKLKIKKQLYYNYYIIFLHTNNIT